MYLLPLRVRPGDPSGLTLVDADALRLRAPTRPSVFGSTCTCRDLSQPAPRGDPRAASSVSLLSVVRRLNLVPCIFAPFSPCLGRTSQGRHGQSKVGLLVSEKSVSLPVQSLAALSNSSNHPWFGDRVCLLPLWEMLPANSRPTRDAPATPGPGPCGQPSPSGSGAWRPRPWVLERFRLFRPGINGVLCAQTPR